MKTLPKEQFYIHTPGPVKEAAIAHFKKLGWEKRVMSNTPRHEFLFKLMGGADNKFSDCATDDAALPGMTKLSLEDFFSIEPEPEFAPKVGEYYRKIGGTCRGNIYLIINIGVKYSLINTNWGGYWYANRDTVLELFGGREKEFEKVEVKITVK